MSAQTQIRLFRVADRPVAPRRVGYFYQQPTESAGAEASTGREVSNGSENRSRTRFSLKGGHI